MDPGPGTATGLTHNSHTHTHVHDTLLDLNAWKNELHTFIILRLLTCRFVDDVSPQCGCVTARVSQGFNTGRVSAGYSMNPSELLHVHTGS